MPAPSPTLSADNEFRFNCPSLGVEAKLADCLTLRDRVWRGEKPEERRACQACMVSSKCAAAQIVHDMWVFKQEPSYHSATPRVGTLDQKLIDRVSRVMVFEKVLDAYGVTDPERGILLTSNADAGKTARRGAAIDTSDWSQEKPKRATRAPRAPKTPDTETVAAAMSGDMSAAVTQAAAAARTVAAPKSKPETVAAPAPATTGLSLMERARLARQGRAA